MASSYLVSAGSLLAVTAGLKISAALQRIPYLYLKNSIFYFLDNRTVMILAGLLEFVVVFLLTCPRSRLSKFLILAWICGVFAAYRLALFWVNAPTSYCPCLGNVGSWLGLSQRVVDMCSIGMLIYLAGGSLVFLARELCARRDASSTRVQPIN